MWTFTTIRQQASQSGDGAARLLNVVQRQPSWITRAALGAGLLVLAGVVLLLVVPMALIASAVFLVLSLGHGALRAIRTALRLDGSGRRNVRVIVKR